MVSAKVLEKVRRQYESDDRVIDLDRYKGDLFDVVFEIVTADTFVAGVASKILDQEPPTEEEKSVVARPLFSEGLWLRESGGSVDLRPHLEIYRVAHAIETLRTICNQALTREN